MNALDSIIYDLEEYLALQRDEGFDAIQVKPDTLRELLDYFAVPENDAVPNQTVSTHLTAGQIAAKKAIEDQRTSSPAKKVVVEKVREVVPLPNFNSMDEIAEHIKKCTRCPLSKTRTCTVPGAGKIDQPDVMFINEAPREFEDKNGMPFTGEDGQLFEKMILAMGYTREDVFLTSVVKCRAYHKETNKDRRPTPDEVAQCTAYLKEQIKKIQPKVIVALGQTAAQILLNETQAITQLRGNWRKYEGIDLMPTYQPALLLRLPEYKADTWTDLKSVMRHLGKPIPGSKK